jgi:hypothetical protein
VDLTEQKHLILREIAIDFESFEMETNQMAIHARLCLYQDAKTQKGVGCLRAESKDG